MSSGDELVTVFPTLPSSAGIRDALLLMIPVREDTVLNLCMYISYHCQEILSIGTVA